MGESEDQVLREFVEDVNSSITTVLFACLGLNRLRIETERFPTHPENPDPYHALGPGPPGVARTQGGWHRSELLDRLAPGGSAHVLLRQQWLCAFYDRWDSYWRPRIAASSGIPTRALVVPVMGDLRHMRNDICHNRGIASAEHTGKCDTLRFFTVGQRIVIADEHLFTIVDGLPWPVPLGTPRR